MPPRYAYWTIIVDSQPTAFRAAMLEELMPTFNRLKEKHPGAELKWFQNGKLWASRLDAREALRERGARGKARDPRQHWRPGGDHKDPRQKYKDAKKARWTRFKQTIRTRHQRRKKRDDE